ncbi:MAG: CDP-alcohol phosphatidyltransferase family protein [Candidatus Omnitrophica bacterium]|nr:CDP-alcohol phosphatidyltransferase family protein [Candidatus Omnitrophota bacterium]MDD5672057.1 CDP-alcohol phosphatidyltransferase family protein [Candidatus Omnitrophota bacterium]
MLRKAIYPKIEALLNSAAKFLNEKGVTPNQLTLAGLVLNFLAGWIYANGWVFFGGLMLLAAGLGDLLDGPVARVGGKSTPFGAFLDSTLDRYSDFFIFGGLALFYAKSAQSGYFLITMGIILGAYITSYSKARAENLMKHCNVGIFERAERLIVLAFGSIIWPTLPFILWILLIGTHATAIHRILYTRKILLKGNEAE